MSKETGGGPADIQYHWYHQRHGRNHPVRSQRIAWHERQNSCDTIKIHCHWIWYSLSLKDFANQDSHRWLVSILSSVGGECNGWKHTAEFEMNFAVTHLKDDKLYSSRNSLSAFLMCWSNILCILQPTLFEKPASTYIFPKHTYTYNSLQFQVEMTTSGRKTLIFIRFHANSCRVLINKDSLSCISLHNTMLWSQNNQVYYL